MPERAPDGTSASPAIAPRQAGLAEAYVALAALLRASPRGRWFLAEYSRRNRTAETDLLLEAIARIERAVLKSQHPRQAAPSNVFAELVEMSEAIARTRREIAQIKPPHQFDKQWISANEELDHVVETTEKATSDILKASEEIQEVAWILRERGTDMELCDKIDQRDTDIYTACSFQDITGQRTGKVVKALRFIEQRINAMIEILGVDDIASKMHAFADTMRDDDGLLHGPQVSGQGLKQEDVDRMMKGRDAMAQAAMSAAAAALRESEWLAAPDTPSAGREDGAFEPLTLAELDAIQGAALFG